MTELTEEQEQMLKNLYYYKKNYVSRDKLYQLIKTIDDHPTKAQVAD